MTVELLWWEGCPSHPETLADLERILSEEGIGAELRRVEIESDEQARREHFPGSPTIRVDGRDVEPGAALRTDFGLNCRLYRSGTHQPTRVPPIGWIEAAIASAVDADRRTDAEPQ